MIELKQVTFQYDNAPENAQIGRASCRERV